MATISEGGCRCGAIRFSVEGHPSNSMICHCQSCRRVSASPETAWVTFEKTRFKIIRGQPSAFSSSAPVWRTFCGACGTPLTYAHQDDPDTVDVTSCSLDNPEAFPPTHHSWLSDDLNWVQFGDRLAAYPEWRK